MSDKPRQEYYAFVHQAIPEIFFQDPSKFFLALQEHGATFPQYIWKQMEKLAKIEYPSYSEKIAVDLSNHGLVSIALLSLPTPKFPTEAYFIALLYRKKTNEDEELVKYLILEFGLNLDGKAQTYFCEWENKDRHRNWGEGPKATKTEFLQKVSETYYSKFI